MPVGNEKLSSKIIGGIGLSAVAQICAISFASAVVTKLGARYEDLAERVQPAIAQNIHLSQLLTDYARLTSLSALTDDGEAGLVLVETLQSDQKTILKLSGQIRSMLPERTLQLVYIDYLISSAMQACADPIKEIAEATASSRLEMIHHLRDKCAARIGKPLAVLRDMNERLMEDARMKSLALAAFARRAVWQIAAAVIGLTLSVSVNLWIAARAPLKGAGRSRPFSTGPIAPRRKLERSSGKPFNPRRI